MSRRRLLTAEQVCTACGVARRTTSAWLDPKRPDAFAGRSRHGRAYKWDAEALLAWLHERGHTEPAMKLADYLATRKRPKALAPGSTPAPPKPKPKRERKPVPSKSAKTDMDIFRTRDTIANMLVDTVAAYDATQRAVDAVAAGKAVRDTAEVLRKLEVDAIDIDEKLRRLMPLGLVQKILGRILSEARTNLQTLRYSMAQDLAALNDAAAVSAFLDSRFTAALRALEEGFLQAEIAAYVEDA